MKRVLVTGAKGFIGKPCMQALKQRNFEIHAISSQPAPENSAAITWHQVDLHNHTSAKDFLQKVRPEYLLHLAWYVKHGAFWTSDENLKWVNSSINLVDQFINNGGKRVIGMGTCAEYDWSDNSCSRSLSENSSLISPSTIYGSSKADLYIKLNTLCQSKGISIAWGRLFFPYGPYESPERLIPNTINSLLQGNISICKQPDLRRDFIFVQDIAEIMAMLVDSQFSGPINIASGEATRLADAVAMIAKILNTEDLVQYGQSFARNNDPPIIVGDITKLKNELGYLKTTTLEKGLEETVAWWKKEYQN